MANITKFNSSKTIVCTLKILGEYYDNEKGIIQNIPLYFKVILVEFQSKSDYFFSISLNSLIIRAMENDLKLNKH